MTRINVIPPDELTDQHLIAEYREIFMVGSSLVRSMRSPHWEKNKLKIPTTFTLNKGHVSFFYNKGLYLENRYNELIYEMKLRGMNPDPNRAFKRFQWPPELYNDWAPTLQAMQIVRARIAFRISQKPNWYRKTKVKITT